MEGDYYTIRVCEDVMPIVGTEAISVAEEVVVVELSEMIAVAVSEGKIVGVCTTDTTDCFFG